MFNAANAPLLPIVRRRGVPVAVHVDGLEWRRAKWGAAGRRFYHSAESVAVRWADALIADAPGIAAYYRDEFGASTEQIAYGAPILADLPDDRLAPFDIDARQFHLVVARFEPENHVHLIVDGYRRSDAEWPLVVVGSACRTPTDYTAQVHAAAQGDRRIRFVGGVWDQQQLDQLYHHAAGYLHGHSVGGTNPSLLRAMGAGASVGAFDVCFNRDVLADTGKYFHDAAGVAALVEETEAAPGDAKALGLAARSVPRRGTRGTRSPTPTRRSPNASPPARANAARSAANVAATPPGADADGRPPADGGAALVGRDVRRRSHAAARRHSLRTARTARWRCGSRPTSNQARTR